MKKYLLYSFFIFLISCVNTKKNNGQFTKEQIESLKMDSTRVLKVKSDSVKEVDLNEFLYKNKMGITPLIKKIKVVPLETSKNSLVDDIYKILPTESNIYIYDNYKSGGIIIFNNNGKFVKRIHNGRGPGELFRLLDIAYDKENKQLIVYQHPFLYFYTALGKFIKRKRLPFGFFNFIVIPDGYIFKTDIENRQFPKFKDCKLFITDKQFRIKSVALIHPEFPGANFGGYSYLFNNNSIDITENFRDTIYDYKKEKNELEAKYVLNFKDKKIPQRYLMNPKKKFGDVRSKGDYYFYIGRFLETGSHCSFVLKKQQDGKETIIYRDNNSGHLKGGSIINFKTNEIPIFGFPISSYGKYFISLHFPKIYDSQSRLSNILSEEDKKDMLNLKEGDNPALIFYELKDF